MFEIVPDYYFQFKCIADKCRHTCCAGWEIDIDDESLLRYRKDGIKHISDGETPHFILDENERCPYLNENNLCELIIDRGEDYLCQICTDHPKFRNYWENITETGLGLCCESAAELILLRKTPMKLVRIDNTDIDDAVLALPDDEKYLWDIRNGLLKRAESMENPMEARLCEYLVFRHIPDALYDGLIEERTALVNRLFNDITSMWDKEESVEGKIEIARAFCEDVEYDTDKIRDFLQSFKR